MSEVTPGLSDEQKKKFFEGHPVVFPFSAGLIVLFVVLAAAFPGRTMIIAKWLQAGIVSNFSWLYIASMSLFLILALVLCFSKFGDIRLGPDGQEPEFPTITWFAMLYSAGMGIGMLFWGVAEPMYHYGNPLFSAGQTPGAAKESMAITLAHWCLHPWALYALVALALAYFGFRRGLPLSFRSVFFPIFGERIHGRLGDVIDIMAVLATLFGLATSLGLGAKQVNAGLYYVTGGAVPQGTWVQVALIAGITACAVLSLVSGLDVGIRRLSETNMGIAAFLLIFLFVAGPTVYLFRSLVENTGQYLEWLPTASFFTAAYGSGEQSSWFGSWTVFYWGWWIAWSPFVGMFIARVSKGRTIREFVVGTLLVPTTVAIIWLTGFGNSALHQEIAPEIADSQARQQVSEQLTAELGHEPDEAQLRRGLLAHYGYEPQTFLVQVKRDGYPLTEDGQWQIGPTIRGVAKPTNVLLRTRDDGTLITKAGNTVAYNTYGVMVCGDDNSRLYAPSPDEAFDGKYMAQQADLSLMGYLDSAVLTEDRTSTVDSLSTVMFRMLDAYPITIVTAILGTVSIILFFITSSDSASLVADIIASGGNQDPPTGTRIFWGCLEGLLAAVLLLAGGLSALQTASITVGLPFCLITLLMCYALFRGLLRERRGALPEEQMHYIRHAHRKKLGSAAEAKALLEKRLRPERWPEREPDKADPGPSDKLK